MNRIPEPGEKLWILTCDDTGVKPIKIIYEGIDHVETYEGLGFEEVLSIDDFAKKWDGKSINNIIYVGPSSDGILFNENIKHLVLGAKPNHVKKYLVQIRLISHSHNEQIRRLISKPFCINLECLYESRKDAINAHKKRISSAKK